MASRSQPRPVGCRKAPSGWGSPLKHRVQSLAMSGAGSFGCELSTARCLRAGPKPREIMGSGAGRLVLAAIPAQIGQLLRVTQLDQLFDAYDTRAWGGSSGLARAE